MTEMNIDYAEMVARFADPGRHDEAMRVLDAGGEAARRAVRDGLSHPDWRVRRGCASFIDRNPDPEAMQRLVLALGDPKQKVRRAVIHALACDMCKPDGACFDAVPHLARVIREDRSIKARRAAVLNLCHQPPDRRIARIMRRVLRDESDEKMKSCAAWILARCEAGHAGAA